MMNDRAGDHKITATTGRVAPDRRWFGNTRVIGQGTFKYHA
jgi:nuclear GTP-binding protein